MEISNHEVVEIKIGKHNWKNQAHTYFDMIWKLGYCTRTEAYQYLAEWLGVEEPQAHMTGADKNTCKQILEFAIQRLNDFRRLDLDFDDPIKHPYFELINTVNA